MYVLLLEKILFEMERKKSVSINVHHLLHQHVIFDMKDKRSKIVVYADTGQKQLLN